MQTPRWALEDYPEAYKEFSEWVLQVVSEAQGGRDPSDNRIDAIRRDLVLKRTLAIKDMSERAAMWQMMVAHKDGWYHLLPGEPDTVREYLAMMSEGADGGIASDLTFLLEQFFPALEKAGVDTDAIVAIPSKWSKTRVAIPTLRNIIATIDDDPVAAAESLKEVLEGISDNSSVKEFRDKMYKLRFSKRVLIDLPGTMYIMPDKTLMVVEVNEQREIDAVQKALGSYVGTWGLGTSWDIINLLGEKKK